MSRTILYYPNIQIPTSGTWIRRALLYWDKLGAIVPQSYDDSMDKKALARYSPEIQRLYKEGIFKPFEPSSIFRDRKAFRRFDTELRAAIKLGSFWLGNPSELTAACNVPIYRDKLTHSMFHELARLGLAKKSTSGLLYLFERQTARVYMALLAKHIADSSNEPTIVGT